MMVRRRPAGALHGSDTACHQHLCRGGAQQRCGDELGAELGQAEACGNQRRKQHQRHAAAQPEQHSPRHSR